MLAITRKKNNHLKNCELFERERLQGLEHKYSTTAITNISEKITETNQKITEIGQIIVDSNEKVTVKLSEISEVIAKLSANVGTS